MSATLIENPSNANFGTGLLVPADGDDFTASCDLIDGNTLQEIADRTQALKLAAPGAASTTIAVPLGGLLTDSGNSFNILTDGGFPFVNQFANAVNAKAWFLIPHLGPGLKIVSATMSFSGGGAHSGLPQHMPTLSLKWTRNASTTNVGTQADTTAVLATYNAAHDVTLTVNHTVVTSRSYYLVVDGEYGTNSLSNQSGIIDLFLTVSPP